MTKFDSKILKGCVIAAFFIIIIMMSQSLAHGEENKSTPDFAFPATVEVNAQNAMMHSLERNDAPSALKYAVEIAIARNLVSADSVYASLKMFGELASKLDKPYSGLANLLEARVYTDIYSQNRWKIDGRAIPSSPVPENIMEWSREMFEVKVSELVSKALNNSSGAENILVRDLTGLIEVPEKGVPENLSLYDFMIIKSCELKKVFNQNNQTNIIPFGGKERDRLSGSADNSSLSLLRSDIKRNRALGRTDLCAYLDYISLFYLSSDERRSVISELVAKYIDTPYCAPFLLRDYFEEPQIDEDSNDSDNLKKENKRDKMIYSDIQAYLNKYPECYGAEALRQKASSMLIRMIEIKVDDDVLPGREFKCQVGLSNIFDFNVILVKLPDSYAGESISIPNVKKYGKIAAVVPFKMEGSAPEKYKGEIPLPALESGVYVALPSSDNTLNGIFTEHGSGLKISTFLVTRLAVFVTGSGDSSTSKVYVVDAFNQKPEAGVKISAKDSRDRNKKIVKITDSEGCVELPVGGYSVKATKDKDTAYYRIWSWGNGSAENKRTFRARVLTDLVVYHPGDSLGFVGIVFSELDRKFRPETGLAVKALLYNANYEPVDTLNLVSDRFGRVEGRFPIPESGLLGYHTVVLKNEKRDLGSASVEVSDYKSPTFFVTMADVENDYKLGDVVKLSGEARTYSGMPVAFSKVKYNIMHVALWWRSYSGNAIYGGEAETDENGKFVINLPTEGLMDTPYASGSFRITASVTSPSGETQESVPMTFSLGQAYHIDITIPSLIQVGMQENKIDVRVLDILYRSVKRKVYYRVEALKGGNDSSPFVSGSFEAPLSRFDFNAFPSGEYRFIFSLEEDFKGEEGNEPVSVKTILFRADEKRTPVATPLWVPETTVNFPADSKKVNVKVGSFYKDSWIFMLKTDCGKELERRWLKVNGNIVEIEVNAPESNQRIFITFSGMHDGERVTKKVTLIPYEQTRKINIMTESFRDRITPGGNEHWKFRFFMNGDSLSDLPVSAVMTNKALDAFVPFEWRFNPYGEIYYPDNGYLNASFGSQVRYNIVLDKIKNSYFSGLQVPGWNLYGQMLYSNLGNGMMRKMNVRGTMKSAATAELSNAAGGFAMVEEQLFDAEPQALEESVVVSDMAAAKSEDAGVAESETESSERGNSDSEVVRDIECPIAFFMPSLVTDERGEVNIDFTVPQFNGTWKFQIMGYSPEMLGSVMTKDAVASKPVMAQMNAPRFVRTGDRLFISGMLYNNSTENIAISGRFELFNPLEGKIIEQCEFAPAEVGVASGRAVTMEYVVGDEKNFLGIRLYATASGFSDGEQTVIPVYPSSTPVIESSTFYIAPGEKLFELDVPDLTKGELTLQYYDNPIWECVTALPDLDELQSANILSKSSALFGNAIGAGLVRDYPEIAEAIKIFSDPANAKDSTLISNLERNASLKAVLLGNTPWVRSAQAETLRMRNLVKYTDSTNSRKVVEDGIEEMGKMQNADGGWSWCGGRESSRFITSRVLSNLAMLEGMGYLPPAALPIAMNAIKYCDREWVMEMHQYKGKSFPYLSMANYLYIRSFFKDVVSDIEFKGMCAKALAAIRSDWKRSDIYDKALAATLLFREGYKMEARTILESLRQYASVTKEKGMWFDKLSSSFMGQTKLLTTAKVLEAFSEISSGSGEIDKLRQWLLITRQAENWGDNRATAEAINAILTSGTRWIASASPARMLIDGRAIETDSIAALTGAFTYSGQRLKGGRLTIERNSDSPAWGGIISQFVAPITDVASSGDALLSIEKNIYKVSADDTGTKASSENLHVGDRVRVTLTIKCDRDLEYVSVVDSRAACLEPVDQISEYSGSDGVWYYREVRDNATNLFITWLPKGTHVINYECFVDRRGEYASGIATAQSQYAPQISAHSAGEVITVE